MERITDGIQENSEIFESVTNSEIASMMEGYQEGLARAEQTNNQGASNYYRMKLERLRKRESPMYAASDNMQKKDEHVEINASSVKEVCDASGGWTSESTKETSFGSRRQEGRLTFPKLPRERLRETKAAMKQLETSVKERQRINDDIYRATQEIYRPEPPKENRNRH